MIPTVFPSKIDPDGLLSGGGNGRGFRTVDGKMCPMCEMFLTWDEFGIVTSAADGVRARCKNCELLEQRTAPGHAVTVATKICTQCGDDKPATAFHKGSRYRSGLQSNCKTCSSLNHKLKTYGLSTDEFLQLHAQANGHCGVCDRNVGAENLDIDHHHGTGEVRGLLCTRCNSGLYLFDDPTLFARACAWANQEV